jgi:hypothetical protein
MNSFTLVGVGHLARNPEVTAKGNVAFLRFCLVGFDLAEPDDEVDRGNSSNPTMTPYLSIAAKPKVEQRRRPVRARYAQRNPLYGDRLTW